MPPYADPDKRNAMLRRIAKKRRSAGLCASCNQKVQEGKSRCADCEARRTRKER